MTDSPMDDTAPRPRAPQTVDRSAEWADLMARVQGGDQAAYRRLLTEILPLLRAMAARAHRDPRDREDTVQDVLLTLHAVRHTFDPSRPFRPWLATIASHRITDRLRRSGRQWSREVVLDETHETYAAPEANMEHIWDSPALHAALAELPEGQRRAITLLKLKEMSLKEAAAQTGMTVGALKVATHRGLRALRRSLSDRNTP